MGWFSDLAGAVTNVATLGLGGNVGKQLGGAVERGVYDVGNLLGVDRLIGRQESALPGETAEQARARLLKEENQRYAKQFREGLSGQQRQMTDQLAKQTSGQLQQGIQGIRQGASARGALYGGGRQAQEQGLRAKAGSQYAQGAQKIRGGLLEQAKKLEDQAIQSGIDIQKQQQDIYDTIYAQAMSEIQAENQAFGSLAEAGGMAAGIAMFSDINMKKNIVPADNKIEEFLDSLSPYEYEYKDQRFGSGNKISIMAQDLEKTELGKRLVVDTPTGKLVNYGAGLETILASIAYVHKKLKQLEVK